MPKAAVIGNTTWGNTLAALLSYRETTVKLWARSDSEAEQVDRKAHGYSSTSCIGEAVEGSDLVIWAVPSQRLRQNVVHAREYLAASMLLISAAKGLEMDSGKRMSEVLVEEIPPALRARVCVLSGPNLAAEISQGLTAASVVAAEPIATAERARELMQSPRFLLSATDDVIGVELAGALKNIVALGAGMMDGLGLGENAKAAFVTWSWAEIVSLGVALGARAGTFYGLAGMGDLVATCAGNLSRNHYLGYEVARGRSLEEVSASMSQVVEGVGTTMAVHQLAQRCNLKAPIADLMYRVLFENLPVPRTLADFRDLIEVP
jgi:glycerol-3-phosphate dehydrogenase (NAD(P)+)